MNLRNMTSIYLTCKGKILLLYRKGSRVVNNSYIGTAGGHFEFFISSSSYVFRKPHPFLFDLASKKAGVEPDEIWFCGDNLLCDIEGAYNAGMKPIFYTAYIDYDNSVDIKVPYAEIQSWSELIEMLKKM